MSGERLRVGLGRDALERCGGRARAVAAGAELVALERDGGWSGEAEGLDAFFLSHDLFFYEAALRSLMGVLEDAPPRWLQSASTGVDHAAYAAYIAAGGTLTNAPGVHGGAIAEYVFAHILHRAKLVAEHAGRAAERSWAPMDSESLEGRTIGLVGYGGIGAAIARRARAFGMRTVATKRRAPEDPHLDAHLTPERLPELLGESDYVVLCVPLTDETVGLIGAEELGRMRRGAMLINVARGRVLDHEALGEALERGVIGHAVLDVAPVEPLPADSRLWDLPNCTITPHDSGHVAEAIERTDEFFLRNLARFARGEALEWVVEDIELSTPSTGAI